RGARGKARWSGSRLPRRVCALAGGDRVDAGCTPPRLRTRLRQTEKAHFALAYEIGHGPDRVLDWNLRIDAMQIVEVDHLHSEALQARLTAWLHALGSCVHLARRPAAGRRHEPELARQDDLAAPIANDPADEDLVRAFAVRVGRVDQRHAEIERTVERALGFLVVARAVTLRHAHAAKADRRHREPAGPELSQLHGGKTTLQFAAI